MGQVYEARGKRNEAGEYYQKAANFARKMPGFDPETVEHFFSKAKKMMEKKVTELHPKKMAHLEIFIEENLAT